MGHPKFTRWRPATFEQRFWAKVDKRDVDECWEWKAAVRPDGYGVIGRDYSTIRAHRASYEINVGPIPAGLQIDHLCRNRKCVNPAHLEAVSQKVNILRGESPPARNARKAHCPQGHPYEGENLYSLGSWRACRTCRYEYIHGRPDIAA